MGGTFLYPQHSVPALAQKYMVKICGSRSTNQEQPAHSQGRLLSGMIRLVAEADGRPCLGPPTTLGTYPLVAPETFRDMFIAALDVLLLQV